MSSYGEDIIRETFEKFGDAIGVQMQMPDAMIANLGAVLQAQIDLLAELQSAGRLTPVGGMALTAEQVENVRAAREELRGYRNFTGYGRSHVNRLIAAVDALFPATEPAEEVKPVHPRPDVGDWGYGGGAAVYAPEARGKTREELLSEKVEQLQDQVKHLSRVAVNAAEHGIKAPSGSLKPCGYCHSTEATLLHACTNCGAMTSDPWSHPAPAEPAEEETKAEAESDLDMHPDAVYGREYVEQAKVRRIARAVKECDTPSSSPVVPAPTETGPWQRIEDVPEGVLQIKDRHGRTWLVVGGTWRFEWHDGNWHEPHTNVNAQAPFVAAAEEG